MGRKHGTKIRSSKRDAFSGSAILAALILCAVITAIPFISELAVSLSSKKASMMNQINLLPVEFTLASWKYVLTKGGIWKPFFISVSSTAIGTALAVVISVLLAYQVPYFLVLRSYGLYNNYWVLILPHILTAYNLIIVRTFFKQFPRELEEAAEIDGCGKFRLLFQIVIPSSKAVLATVGLFYGVTMWNQYEHPLMFIQDMSLFPLQAKIRAFVDGGSELQAVTMQATANYTQSTLSAAAVVFAMIPVLIVYPFLQKYFAKGAMLGSVKG